MSSVPHFAVFIGTNGLFSRVRLLLISRHNNKLFLFTELANIVVVIVTNPMFILPWVHEKFTVKFTMSNVDGCAIYIHIGCLNCPEYSSGSPLSDSSGSGGDGSVDGSFGGCGFARSVDGPPNVARSHASCSPENGGGSDIPGGEG